MQSYAGKKGKIAKILSFKNGSNDPHATFIIKIEIIQIF